MKKLGLVLSALVLGACAALLVWIVVFTDGLAAAGDSVQWAQFAGRFRPVVLHLPIGLFLGLFVIELISLRSRSEGVQRCTLVLVWLMALTSALAAYFGLLLASNGDYSGATFDWHKWLGIAFTAIALLLAFFKVLASQASKSGAKLYWVSMVGLMLLLPAVGHYGGHLTHGVGYLTHYAPDWLSPMLGGDSEVEGSDATGASGDAALAGNLFTEQVQPIFAQYCYDCHGPEKQKSRYRMDSFEYLMTPGSMGDTPVQPGEMAGSSLLEYMLLPESHDLAMPPEGKARPSAEEIMLVAHWIASGAEGPPVDEAALAAEKAALEAERAEMETLFAAGVILLPMGKDSELLYLDFQNAGETFSDEVLELLASYKDRIYELKLIGEVDAVSALQALQGAPELRQVNLSGLKNADSTIELVNSFAGVERLNLFGSELSDAGLSQLSLPNLRSLYIGSTKVSADQIAAYAQAKPTVEVIGDIDMSSIEAIKVIDAENSSKFNPQSK